MAHYIATIREFSEFMEALLPMLRPKLEDQQLSAVESRVLSEIWMHSGLTAKDLQESLDMDKGQLSRLLTKLTERGVIEKRADDGDKRRVRLAPTSSGARMAQLLMAQTDKQATELVEDLSSEERARLAECMDTIMDILGQEQE